ncbi:hypothetical protein FOZ76_24525 [Verticiella sediminum]|uniref:Tyr recombinase domain-containing protein n=1 Tax=Verticiella sediminum TaxID=1247510 RepID=A0A556A7F6_9BURK|nr:hypothetical protein [Verticiella sediminum]TSH88812.1 hypothetical protein FOZ76_24525 [Verticiella sediminum]
MGSLRYAPPRAGRFFCRWSAKAAARTNPCRRIPMFSASKAIPLVDGEDMVYIFRHPERLEAEGLERCAIPLALRLQFAVRRSKIVSLEWERIDLEERHVIWPDARLAVSPSA